MFEITNLMIGDVIRECFRVRIGKEDIKYYSEKGNNYSIWEKEKSDYRDATPNALPVGILGELAFAKVFNMPMDTDYKRGGDRCDFIINKNIKVDVKTSMTWKKYKSPKCFVRVGEKGKEYPIDKDIYVTNILEEFGDDKCIISLVGYITGKRVNDLSNVESKKYENVINKEIPILETEPISKMYNYIKNKIGLYYGN